MSRSAIGTVGHLMSCPFFCVVASLRQDDHPSISSPSRRKSGSGRNRETFRSCRCVRPASHLRIRGMSHRWHRILIEHPPFHPPGAAMQSHRKGRRAADCRNAGHARSSAIRSLSLLARQCGWTQLLDLHNAHLTGDAAGHRRRVLRLLWIQRSTQNPLEAGRKRRHRCTDSDRHGGENWHRNRRCVYPVYRGPAEWPFCLTTGRQRFIRRGFRTGNHGRSVPRYAVSVVEAGHEQRGNGSSGRSQPLGGLEPSIDSRLLTRSREALVLSRRDVPTRLRSLLCRHAGIQSGIVSSWSGRG